MLRRWWRTWWVEWVFFAGLSHILSREGRDVILFGYIDISGWCFMYISLRKRSWGMDKILGKRGPIKGMSSGSRRVLWSGHHSNRNWSYMFHKVWLHLQSRIKVSIIIRTSKLNLLILRAAWHKGVVCLIHAKSVVGTIKDLLVRDPVAISSVVRMGILCECLRKNH